MIGWSMRWLSTMIAVFPQVYIIDTRFSNAILIGVNQPSG